LSQLKLGDTCHAHLKKTRNYLGKNTNDFF
jgi:hypothetical protein